MLKKMISDIAIMTIAVISTLRVQTDKQSSSDLIGGNVVVAAIDYFKPKLHLKNK